MTKVIAKDDDSDYFRKCPTLILCCIAGFSILDTHTMKNILVATDFSPEAHHAFAVAVQLARHTGGQLTLLHVLEALEE